MADIIGTGISFPLRIDRLGALALSSGDTDVKEAIDIILGTAPGERPMRPEFGCRINEYVFAPADATTAGLIAYDVRRSLLRWEPRIDVGDVVVEPDPDDPATLYISVHYTIPRTNDPRNLVFPFYTIPPELPPGPPPETDE
jgi:phage baseplate assembly protein W